MAYAPGDRVRVADSNSEYRLHTGTVRDVQDDLHTVRIDGHACRSRQVLLRTDQLQPQAAPSPFNYQFCG